MSIPPLDDLFTLQGRMKIMGTTNSRVAEAAILREAHAGRHCAKCARAFEDGEPVWRHILSKRLRT